MLVFRVNCGTSAVHLLPIEEQIDMASTTVTLFGNLTRDPELTFTTAGQGKLDFSIACNEYWNDKNGERQEKTSYFDIIAWRNLAEDAANLLEKGLPVVIVGRMEQQTWEDKETGKPRSKVQVVADRIAVNVTGISSVSRKVRDAGDAPKKAAKPAPKKAVVEEEDEPF
jgi:single-strand DNA-binding protein